MSSSVKYDERMLRLLAAAETMSDILIAQESHVRGQIALAQGAEAKAMAARNMNWISAHYPMSEHFKIIADSAKLLRMPLHAMKVKDLNEEHNLSLPLPCELESKFFKRLHAEEQEAITKESKPKPPKPIIPPDVIPEIF